MQKKYVYPILFALVAVLSGCIGDDIIDDRVEEQIRIMSNVDTIGFGEEYQFEASFFNNVGAETETAIQWSSSDENIITIDQTGLAKAIASGTANIYASVELSEKVIRDTISVIVGENTVVQEVVRSGELETTSNYVLEGSFSMKEVNGLVRISLNEDYKTSDGIPGLYIYLSNNSQTISGALEVAAVEVLEGAHHYDIEVDINQYAYILYWCKPFNVDVGLGKIE